MSSKTSWGNSPKHPTNYLKDKIKTFINIKITNIRHKLKNAFILFLENINYYHWRTQLQRFLLNYSFTSVVLSLIIMFIGSQNPLLKAASIIALLELSLNYLSTIISTIKKALK